MFKKLLSCYIFTIAFLELITKTHLTFHDSSHGFISKNPRYFDDDLSHIHEGIASLRYLHKADSSANLNLRFEPELLDFQERPLGIPYSKTVTLFNIDNNKTIDLTSISGNTVHFHSSFFEDKKIPPNGNTSFKIVYLGRQEGHVESSLFLHTSSGFIKYNVKAFGSFSNYRVRPIVDVKLPVNSTFTPVIYVHNPHMEPIQIVEIYSSGGGFHLELPSGQHEGPNELWEIQPQETKAVIRVRFEAKVAQNHTAYIRIKLHNPDEILIVPLEVEVSPVLNIFHPQGHIDFGIGGHMDPPREVNLCLFNPLRKPVRVHSVSTLSKSIKTQYYNIRINPGNEKENNCVNVGTLTVDWRNAWKAQDYNGKIIVKFRNGKNRTEIPYYLTVLRGGISYDKMATTYFLNEKEIDTSERRFEVRNEYQYPVKIMAVTFPFDADSHFKIKTFTPKIVKPYDKQTLFNIKLKNTVRKTDMQLTSSIKLITNISEIYVPLLSYNGKLQVHLPFKSDDYSLNAGLISYNTKKDILFMLTNPNPVSLPLSNVYSSIPMTEVELYGCGSGNHKMVLLQGSLQNLTKCDSIAPHGYALIRLTVSTNHIEGQVWGDVQIETPFENLSLPVHFRVSPGKLAFEADSLVFDDCFPGKICSHQLKVYSSFNEKMMVEHIVALPPDKRITASITGSILSKSNRVIGHLYFNPDIGCSPECYLGFLSEGSASWLRTLAITKQVSEYDLQLVNMFYMRYLNYTEHGLKTWTNLTLRLDTSEVKGYIFKTNVAMAWPSLVEDTKLANKSVLEFPLTQVGNCTYKHLVLHNPASYNIVVQLLFDNDYPHAEMLYDGLPSKFIPPSEIKYASNKGFSFDEATITEQQIFFWENLKMKIHKQSMPFLLLPGQTQRVTIGFFAEDAKIYTSLLFLRNNLTILEVLRLNGKGSVPRFKFGNRKPGAIQPLLFEMTDKHMKDCEKQRSYLTPLPNLTVKRSFTARNLGDIAVHISSFHINDYDCEGYGFKVMDCEPFTLPPNGTKKIDIAFTPDLTLTKVSRTLILGTSLNILVNYSLYTTIPQRYLHMCSELIERPPWEIYMSYVTIVFMKVMFFLIMFIAVLDAESIKRQALEAFIVSNSPAIQPILDLRKIGRQIREEIQSSKEKKRPEYDEITQKGEDEVEEQDNSKSEPAIVPTTGKAKKKLAQRNSLNDLEDPMDEDLFGEKIDKEKERAQRKKDILFERHRLKSKERRTEKELKLLEERGKKEKHAQHKDIDPKRVTTTLNKKISKITIVPAQEEETSSTTTESSNSSSNYEEVEKENQRGRTLSKQKVRVLPQMTKPVKAREASINILESKCKHVSFLNSKLKPRVKVQDKQKDMEQCGEKSSFLHHGHRDSKRREGKYKDRKEKMIYRNKNHNERKSKMSENDSFSLKEKSNSPISFYIPFPTPTTIPTVWGESRAKFSDVVARNETSIPSTQGSNSVCSRTGNIPFSQGKPTMNKPTMYVEPYKPAELGPIGSKRLESPGNQSPELFGDDHHNISATTNFVDKNAFFNSLPLQNMDYRPINDKSIIAAISNNTLMSTDSFFSQSQGIRLDGTRENNYFSSITAMEAWNRQQVFKNLLETQEQNERTVASSSQMEDPWNKDLLNSNAYWSNNLNLLDSNAPASNSSSYLWGSNPVWKPWSPDAPSTPRRTPPGFDEHIQKKRVEEEQKKLHRDSYSPFGSGCTWSQKNPWD